MLFVTFAYAIMKLFLQISYDCAQDDEEQLESLQRQIQDRITFLKENNLDSYGDPTLLEYYDLYSQIQQCVFDDHTDQYLLIGVLVVVFSLLVYFRWRMIKNPKKT